MGLLSIENMAPGASCPISIIVRVWETPQSRRTIILDPADPAPDGYFGQPGSRSRRQCATGETRDVL